MNSVNLIGRLTTEPELKQTNSGKSVVTVVLAVNDYGDKANFLPLITWEKNAENLCRYCSKGMQIGVSGRLTSRNYKTNDGTNRTVIEVVVSNWFFADAKKEQQAQQPAQQSEDWAICNDETPF